MIIANTKTRTVKVTGGDLLNFSLVGGGSVTFEYDKNGALCSCVVRDDSGSVIPLTVYNFDAGALAALSRDMQVYLDAAPLQA